MAQRVAPQIDDESEPFWTALAEHRILIQRCGSCEHRRFPPLPSCPFCGSPVHMWTDYEGRPSLYSYVVVRRAFDEQFESEVPYTVATVELEPGVRTVARVEGEITIDGLLMPLFVDHDNWTELRFMPVSEADE